ncbi:AAA family ATPase [Salinarchaeum sp. IM2453]|uniref:ATPase domain-containing protein n=1 Tax=Salinarchaeum sp. IM2453 TaxID=2862870 RepID=UPI001C82E561|nr:ATPase domain-containing protein [Salinarchaeum sp. IM2453]QZA87634.1 AAA family ATPase [Salinarchaeum sp. IM2453]
MTERESLVPTGVEVLDQLLRGGLPEQRSTLVTGAPGTGKSTLGMQFLQTGVEHGESGLYISTEQTIEELQDSFDSFEFDLEHSDLYITSIHATPGQTIESDEALTLQTLDEEEGDSPLGEYGIPFTPEYIKRHLREFAPVDRVVFDSTSGLEIIADDRNHYRRVLLDLIRFFSDELEATTVFTAERTSGEESGSNVLEFTTHGVIKLSYGQVNKDRHRFLEITKMRGVSHDQRRVELEFCKDGIQLAPKRRSQPPQLKNHRHQPIGIEGLDSLTGGGLVTGAGVLLQHDGQKNLSAMLMQLLSHAMENGRQVMLVPTIGLREKYLRTVFQRDLDWELDTLLDSNRLAVVDIIGSWDQNQENVYGSPRDIDEYTGLLEQAKDPDRDALGIINADAIVHTYGAADARKARYSTETTLTEDDDLFVHIQNPGVVTDEVAAFYHDAAEQVLKTWVEDDGLQYVTLKKSPCGFVGTTSLMEYTQRSPYLRVQSPPRPSEGE